MLSFDVVVLGGGPGGYVAALRAAQLGLKVCLVEKDALGGVCLNRGCIPSKTLLTGTELFSKIKKAGEWGIEIATPPVWNLKKLFDKKEEVINRMRQGLEALCQKRKVLIVKGEGTLIGPRQVRVGTETYHGQSIVLATGSSPRKLDFGLGNTDQVLSSEEALSSTKVPGELLILGGGPEGCEFALIYSGWGSKVTLIEAKERLLPSMDRDAGAAMKRVMTARGIEVLTEEKVSKAVKNGSKIDVTLQSGKAVSVDTLLVSVGRVPNSQGIGLETVGVTLNERKAVATDAFLRSNVSSIYAIGDLAGKYMMAHSASHEGYSVASAIAGKPEVLDYSSVPSCVYTYPEVAEVGLSEEKAKDRNIAYEIGRFSFMALGRSHAKGQTEGFVKVIGNAKTQEVLGGVIVGEGASEMINVIGLAVQKKLKVDDLRNHIAPHPSASEAIVEASHLFFKEGLHFA